MFIKLRTLLLLGRLLSTEKAELDADKHGYLATSHVKLSRYTTERALIN